MVLEPGPGAVGCGGATMSLTDRAIARIRELIQSGELSPGSKLPPEPQLAMQLGLSRNLMREAVKVLEVARVLEVRRGDGTYVTSLQPDLLLGGLGGAVELLQGDTDALLDLMEVRRLFEPVAAALAATRIAEPGLAEVKRHLDAMRAARDDVELLNLHDAAFHRAVIAATGNDTLVTLLEGISGKTRGPGSGAGWSTATPRAAPSPSTRRSTRRWSCATVRSRRRRRCCMSATPKAGCVSTCSRRRLSGRRPRRPPVSLPVDVVAPLPSVDPITDFHQLSGQRNRAILTTALDCRSPQCVVAAPPSRRPEHLPEISTAHRSLRRRSEIGEGSALCASTGPLLA